jgi:putative nucleotidyltransferase with HDIG domain
MGMSGGRTGTVTVGGLVTTARVLAEVLLEELPDRWRHTIGVAHRADQLSVTVEPADRETLVAAAWLHDIGYGRVARRSGFHPLDGAEYLIRHGWSPRIAALVAHHSAAHLLAGGSGPLKALHAHPDERSPVSDALAYADQTTGPAGQPLPIRVRMAEMLTRHGTGSAQARVHHLREPYLLAAAGRVEARRATAAGAWQLATMDATRPASALTATQTGAPAAVLAQPGSVSPGKPRHGCTS